MIPIDIDDEVHHAIYTAACTGDANQRLRHLLRMPHAPCPPTDLDQLGELAGVIAAGMLMPDEPLYATGPVRDPHPIATVVGDGRLRANDTNVYPGPRALITALRGRAFAAYAWHCLATGDGGNMETLRQRATGDQQPHPGSHGALTPLIAAGLLAPGDRLRLAMHRHNSGRVPPIAVGTATVTDDGFFLLPDGSRHANPYGAAAAYRGNPAGAWASWAAPDRRRLQLLRDLSRP